MKLSPLVALLIVACLSLVTVDAFGQEPSKKEMLAAELLEQLHMQRVLDGAFDAIPQMQEQMLASQKLSPEELDKFHQRMQKSMEATKKALSWETIKPMFIKIYADNFDEGDLQGLLAFYKGPVGQKFMEKQPAIQAATMQAMGQIMPKIQAAVIDSLKESDDDAPSATKSTP